MEVFKGFWLELEKFSVAPSSISPLLAFQSIGPPALNTAWDSGVLDLRILFPGLYTWPIIFTFIVLGERLAAAISIFSLFSLFTLAILIISPSNKKGLWDWFEQLLQWFQ